MEGAIFKAFVELKKLNKTKLATDLGMSKQNLYQLFESKSLQPETIEKIERKFRLKWDKIKQVVNIDVPRGTTKPQEPQKDRVSDTGHNEEKKDYLSGKNLDNFSEAHRKLVDTNSELALAIVRALPGIQSDRVLAPKIAQWLREYYSGKKEVPVDELLKELQKASMPDSSYRQ